jgi:glucokinase
MASPALVLAGDVGGTKTALGLFAADGEALVVVREATLPSRQFASAEAILAGFLAEGSPGRLAAACLGVAGPVVDGCVVATNLPWALAERDLAAALGVARVRLLNDLEATGHGVLGLGPEALACLQPGAPRAGNRALIAAGTGLGEALLVREPVGWRVVACEGGHVDFAPRDDREIGLLRWLRAQFGRVSYERVLSGPGLLNLYRFLRDAEGAPEPPALRDRLAGEDPAAVIAEAGLAGTDPVCRQALEMFVSIYGAEAGNLALKALATGGVVVGGGIAPRILPMLGDGRFMEAFRAKGRLTPVLEAIPVHVALEPRAALLGAARVAARLATEPAGA